MIVIADEGRLLLDSRSSGDIGRLERREGDYYFADSTPTRQSERVSFRTIQTVLTQE